MKSYDDDDDEGSKTDELSDFDATDGNLIRDKISFADIENNCG